MSERVCPITCAVSAIDLIGSECEVLRKAKLFGKLRSLLMVYWFVWRRRPRSIRASNPGAGRAVRGVTSPRCPVVVLVASARYVCRSHPGLFILGFWRALTRRQCAFHFPAAIPYVHL